ncbi:peptidyl-tRNA hydrolase [Clostridia bacterium]|nr:peptidyl-tRNA hydrolase [Clostridia bacterium]
MNPRQSASFDYIIAGLGNPGREYDGSRHNAGFCVLERLAAAQSLKIKKAKFKALTADGVIFGKRVLLLKPQTFMNLSGEAVGAAMRFYKLDSGKLIVVYDDMALPCGKLRLRGKGSDGGHNGIKSILYHVGSDVFPRVKIGVGEPPSPEYDRKDWVLGGFSAGDAKSVAEAEARAVDALEAIMKYGIDEAMNRFNGG